MGMDWEHQLQLFMQSILISFVAQAPSQRQLFHENALAHTLIGKTHRIQNTRDQKDSIDMTIHVLSNLIENETFAIDFFISVDRMC